MQVGLSAPDYSCLYALGGGKVSAEGGFPQPRLHDKNSDCPSVVKHYIEVRAHCKQLMFPANALLLVSSAHKAAWAQPPRYTS